MGSVVYTHCHRNEGYIQRPVAMTRWVATVGYKVKGYAQHRIRPLKKLQMKHVRPVMSSGIAPQTSTGKETL